MEEKNQQDRFLGVDRELGDDPAERVKVEGASQEYEFSSEESEAPLLTPHMRTHTLDSHFHL
jgi:hypothetical protein